METLRTMPLLAWTLGAMLVTLATIMMHGRAVADNWEAPTPGSPPRGRGELRHSPAPVDLSAPTHLQTAMFAMG